MRENGKSSSQSGKRGERKGAVRMQPSVRGRPAGIRRETVVSVGDRQERRHQAGEERERRRGNPQILLLAYAITAVFLCMAGYLAYFMVAQSQDIINNPYNKRQEVLAKKIRRGKIMSADGKVLAETKTGADGTDTREYPYGDMFCHIVGRTTNSMTGIEGNQCYPLLASHINPLKQLANTFQGEKNPGDNVITTLDTKLQQAAYAALGNQKGAVVALEPSTGKILAMVSKPAYDPNQVAKNWEELISYSSEDSALVNRATQGLYPPGSTFKLLTAMEYIIENPDSYTKFRYQCEGTDSFSGNVINCYGRQAHGKLNLKQALAKSCNAAFAEIGTTLDITSFRKLTEKFLFNKSLPVDFEYNKSKFDLTEDSDLGELTQTVMGQGKTMMTPIENAMIAATVANNGEMMVPYVVDRVESDAGKTVREYQPESNGQVIDEWVAEKINRMMQSVVTDGTGYVLDSLPYKVAAKTGSAEFDSEGNSHAWFVGFAPADNPEIAVSVIVEGAGTGSRYAAPVAKRLFEEYLD